MTEDDRILKEFLEEHFDFKTLKSIGFFPKEIRKKDIHAQARLICELFGYKTVFEYGSQTIYAHVSYAPGHRPLHVDEHGELQEAPFVEKFGGIYDD